MPGTPHLHYHIGMTASQHGNSAEEPAAGRFCILGTAGHIDHGKSALVEALTGTDPDRLEEEKARGMTIVLGFARLRLPRPDGKGDLDLGVVDVPGHERFLKTMVAGATGVDLGLLVVAADDGVMPQTREHVDILDLLGVESGIITISKADLAHEGRIEEVRGQIAELVRATPLADWPVVPTSVKANQGLDDLRAAIQTCAAARPARPTRSIFRLAIDRVFAVRGRGTVVTGSVLSGHAKAADILELQPAGATCKVREAQSHGEVVHDVVGGQRAALNLTGLNNEPIERGMDLATPGYLMRSRYVDARVRILPRCNKPFISHGRARVSMGTWETMATVVVIGGEKIEPGREAPVQLQLCKPVVAAHGQRFILRSESTSATIGGGRVVRPVSSRVRPLAAETLAEFRRAESDDAYVRVGEAIRRAGLVIPSPTRLACEAGVEPDEVGGYIRRLEKDGLLTRLGPRQVHRLTLDAIEKRSLGYLNRHHAKKTTEPGVPKDQFIGWIGARTVAGLGRDVFDSLLSQGRIVERGPYVAHHKFQPALSNEDAALVERFVQEIAQGGFDPPAWDKLRVIAPLSSQRAKILHDLAKTEPRLVSYAPRRYISADALGRFQQTIGELGGGGRRFKLADVRDALNLSRRVVQPLLEHLDRVGFTQRIGDERVLREAAR